MVAAIAVLTTILSFVMVAINNCITATIDSQSRMAAFQIARENMENLLAKNSVEEDVQFGISETNPDLEWQTTIESFYEPITTRMWIQAVCSASYTDSNGERQEVQLTHWITDLSKSDIQKILDQETLEAEYLAQNGEDGELTDPPEPPIDPPEPVDPGPVDKTLMALLRLAEMTDAQIREFLADRGYTPEQIDEALRKW